MAVVLNTQLELNPNNQIAHIADWTGLEVEVEYLITASFLQPDTRFTFHGYSDIALSRQPLGVPASRTEVPCTIGTPPQPHAATPPAGYPYVINDRFIATKLNDAWEFNAKPTPPAGNGGGAGQFNEWVDTTTPGLAVMRMCVVPQAKAGVYDPAEWVTIATIDTTNKKFVMDGATMPIVPQAYVRIAGDVMTGNLSTPGLSVEANRPGNWVVHTIRNTSASGGFAQLSMSTGLANNDLSLHIGANATVDLQMGSAKSEFRVWGTYSSNRVIGGFTVDGWANSLDARHTVRNDGTYCTLSQNDPAYIGVYCNTGQNLYRSGQHTFQSLNGGVSFGYFDSTGIVTGGRVSAHHYDISGALFVQRDGTYTYMYDPSSVYGLATGNNGVNLYVNDQHHFNNRPNNTNYAAITGSGMAVNSGGFTVSNGWMYTAGGNQPGYRFMDRTWGHYFEWHASDGLAKLYTSNTGGIPFQITWDGWAYIGGIQFGNWGGWFRTPSNGIWGENLKTGGSCEFGTGYVGGLRFYNNSGRYNVDNELYVNASILTAGCLHFGWSGEYGSICGTGNGPNINQINSGQINVGCTQINGNGVSYLCTGVYVGMAVNFSEYPNLRFHYDGNYVMTLNSFYSDIRLKTNVVPTTTDAVALVKQVQMVEYDMFNVHYFCGVTAQQIQPFMPDAITTGPEDAPVPNQLQVNPLVLSMYNLKALQELIARVEALETRL